MPEFKEVKISRILNPTSIDLGEFVINPYMGCEFACLYCYVRSNKAVTKRNKDWGEFIDIRVNAVSELEKEIALKKPGAVLLGSTTECFQPAEKKYGISGKTLEVLNKHKVHYVILTRSPFILDYLDLLKKGFCRKIYFTVNKFAPGFKSKLEAKSPAFDARARAVNTLLEEGINVIPYFSPILPWVSDIKDVFLNYKKAESAEFECLNFRLENINAIIKSIAEIKPHLGPRYEHMRESQAFYEEVWGAIKHDIENQAKNAKKRYNIYVHNFGDYFKNTYNPSDSRC